MRNRVAPLSHFYFLPLQHSHFLYLGIATTCFTFDILCRHSHSRCLARNKMYSYVLFRNNKRVNLREDDLTSAKISRIFQVAYSLEANAMLLQRSNTNTLLPCLVPRIARKFSVWYIGCTVLLRQKMVPP